MIRRQLARLGALGLIVVLCGCYNAPVRPPIGNIYSDFAAPLDVDADGLGKGSKTGRSSSFSVLGLVAWGDCSVDAAASEGGLQSIHQVDYEFFHVLGIYQKFTTVAHGD